MAKPIDDLHIDDFCKDTAKILLSLFRRFPVKTTLYVEDIAGADTPDEFGLHSPRFEAGFSAMIWLQEADYIQYSSPVNQEAVEEAVLSHRGFTLLAGLDTCPTDITSDTSNAEELALQGRRIDRIKHALQSGSSEELKSLVLRYMLESRNLT